MHKKNTISSSFSYIKPYSMQGTYKSHQLYRAMLLFIFLAFIVIPSRAQDTVLVKGTIYSQTNQPIPNVSVSIAGSFQRPSVTNEAGEFTLVVRIGTGLDHYIANRRI